LTPINSTGAFAAATSVLIATTTTPGTRQSYTVTGLASQSTYYFAITTKDGVGVRSNLSNGATVLGNIIVLPASAGDTYTVAWGDFDGDGDLDLALGNYNQDKVLYRNDGGNLFTKTTFLVATT